MVSYLKVGQLRPQLVLLFIAGNSEALGYRGISFAAREPDTEDGKVTEKGNGSLEVGIT